MTLGLEVICGDERTISRMVESAAEVDFAAKIAVWSGRNASTFRLLSAAGFRVIARPWTDHFAVARNIAHEALGTDWSMWMDSDDVIQEPQKIAELVERAERRGLSAIDLPYAYRRNDVEVTCWITSRRIVRRKDYRWEGRVAETLEPCDAVSGSLAVHARECWIDHLTESGDAERREYYRGLAELAVEDGSATSREMYFLGRCHHDAGRYGAASRWYWWTLARLAGDDWQRQYSILMLIAWCQVELERWKEARRVVLLAEDLFPESGEPAFVLATVAYRRGMYGGAVSEARRGLAMDMPVDWPMPVDPTVFTVRPTRLLIRSLTRSGHPEAAIHIASDVLKRCDDQIIKDLRLEAQQCLIAM